MPTTRTRRRRKTRDIMAAIRSGEGLDALEWTPEGYQHLVVEEYLAWPPLKPEELTRLRAVLRRWGPQQRAWQREQKRAEAR